jgi:HK97 gp10 family phage protein
MAVDDGVRLQGWDDLIAKLRALPGALRVRVLLNALRAGARPVRDAARAHAPVLQKPVPYRTVGLVRKSIVVRTSKTARQAGDVGVFVNVRPAKGARFKTSTSRVFGLKVRTRTQTRASLRGARSPVDPFYWRFVAFGTRKMRARNFLQAGANKLTGALPVIQAALDKWIAKTNASGKIVP